MLVTPERRRYIRTLGEWTRRDIAEQFGTRPGRLVWAVLQPVLAVAAYALIFGVIFSQSGGTLPYLSYLVAGVVVYRAVTGAFGSVSCISDRHDLLTKVAVPIEMIPISRTLANSVDTTIVAVGLIVVAVVQGVSISVTVVALPLILIVVTLFAAGVGVLLSTVQVFLPGLQHTTSFLGLALFFASPISYQPDQLPPELRWLNVVNPISVFIEAVRDVALRSEWPEPLFYLQASLTVLLLLGSIGYLRALRGRVVDLG
jgi:ABC-type polysaccharide/polyol phosphate export permease